MIEVSHKFDLWPIILVLEGNGMLYEAKKHLSWKSWNRVQNSECVGVTTEKFWMVHHHELSAHNKLPDALEMYLSYMIYPDVRYKGSMMKTPEAGITWHNQSILVETDQGADIHSKGLLTHSDPTSFFIFKPVFHLP